MNLRVERLSFAYRAGRPVLQDLSLEFAPGNLTGLFGPNGCGKSTLLRCLSGALRPQSGGAWCGGCRADTLAPREAARRVAVVPQDGPRDVPLTAWEMVAMGRFAAGDEDPARISAALTRVGAAELAGRPFDELSGGERQRVVVARALAQEAPVLLLDEPAAHLDVGHQVELYRLARALAREGRTVVMACHDLFLAPRFLDRAILLVDGHLTALGTPDKVLAPEILRATFGIGLRIDRAPGATVVVCPGGALHEEARPAA